jgi:hypothetical protein
MGTESQFYKTRRAMKMDVVMAAHYIFNTTELYT